MQEKISKAAMVDKLVVAMSDQAQCSIARYALALKTTLTGNPNRSTQLGNLAVASAFPMQPEVIDKLLREQADIGMSKIFAIHDLDDPMGPPIRFDLIFVNEWFSSYHTNCALWVPQSGSRTMIVPEAEALGFFSFKVGRRLSYIHRDLPGAFETGNRRAMDRFNGCVAKVPAPDMEKFYFSIRV